MLGGWGTFVFFWFGLCVLRWNRVLGCIGLLVCTDVVFFMDL